MGTDIHFYVEKKVEGSWTLVWPTLIQARDEYGIEIETDGASPSLYARFPGKWVDTYEEIEKTLGTWEERFKHPLYIGRNYDLFAILADVRNGRGFAGVKTGDGFNVIAEPRGVPADASPEFAWEVERNDGDGHSHSWFTVRELLDYDWEQTTHLEGDVGPSGYLKFKETGAPHEWCGWVSGPSIKHVSNEEMEALVGSLSPESDPKDRSARVYTRVSWRVTYRECAGKFLTHTLPALQQIGDPDDVRICFFFDN